MSYLDDPNFRPVKLTKLSEPEAVYWLKLAYEKVIGETPSVDSLALLWSQWALEQGRGVYMKNFSYGNIKRSGNEPFTSYRCNEIINNKTVWFEVGHPATFFRAFDTALEGALDYVQFLAGRSRYKSAWEMVKKGDPAGFSHELRVHGYYTASENLYTRNIVSLTNEFKSKSDKLLSWQPEKAEDIYDEPEEAPVTSRSPVSEVPAVALISPEPVKPAFVEAPKEAVVEKNFIMMIIEFFGNLFGGKKD